MQLSVIILNYNVRYFLEQCILSVQSALVGMDAEIIVVDNNSSDGSCQMMDERFPNIKFIENDTNLGFPKGNNIGVSFASGKYICILNPDTVVAEDTFVKVIAFADKQSNLGIVGVKLIDGRGNFLPESKRGIPTPFVAITKIMGLYKISKAKAFGKYYAMELGEDETGKVDILVGAFMVMKRELYLEVGGFDEECFMYSDDIDLSYMVLKRGRSNYYYHDTTVIHYKGESTVKDGTYMRRFREAMHFFYKKHFKVNVFFDVFMKTGAFFFIRLKRRRGVTVSDKIESYVVLSENKDMREKIQKALGKETIYILASKIGNMQLDAKTFNKNVEIIFDNNYLSFKSIINWMELNRNPKITFKILPKLTYPGTDYLIGSNSSNDRGEVIMILDF